MRSTRKNSTAILVLPMVVMVWPLKSSPVPSRYAALLPTPLFVCTAPLSTKREIRVVDTRWSSGPAAPG